MDTIAKALGEEIGDLINLDLARVYPPCFYSQKFLEILGENLEIESDGESVWEYLSFALQDAHVKWKSTPTNTDGE